MVDEKKKLFRQLSLYGNKVHYDKSERGALLGFYINNIFIIFHSNYEARIIKLDIWIHP